MAHVDPLPEDETDLREEFETFEEILGFVPNSLLTMQRVPEVVEGFDYLTQKVMKEADAVDPGFKRLAAHVASSSAGCQYCEAHSLIAADIHGVIRTVVAFYRDDRATACGRSGNCLQRSV